jgi:3-carboxy-cis,cis-muconate cycloisomerase
MMPRPTFDPGFSTEELTSIFSARSTVEAMLDFEAALALALGDAGLAPVGEAEEVAAACRAGVPEPEGVLASTWENGTPLIKLLDAVSTSIDNEEARQWLHFGATSQDAIDTGAMLQAARALAVTTSGLTSLAGLLCDLTVGFRDQPQMGRTFLQEARPITFGLRTASWLDAVIGHIGELRGQREILHVQLGGPVGDLSAYGEQAAKVVAALAARLQLSEPDISWHTNRTPVLALAQAVERTALTMAKVGSDVAILASNAISEISVRSGGSSSMPEKRNPIDAVRAIAAARACVAAVSMMTTTEGKELDRGIGGWHVEWMALPLVFQTAGAAVEAIENTMQSLEVDREKMTANAGPDSPTVASAQIDRVLAAYDRIIE